MRSGEEFGCAFWDTRRWPRHRAERRIGMPRTSMRADVPGHPDVAHRPRAVRRGAAKSQSAGYRSADEADVDAPNAPVGAAQRLYSGTTAPVPAPCVVTAGSPRYWIVPVPVSVASSVPVAFTRMVPVPWSCALLLAARRS